MKVAVVGAGPAGLYFSILMARAGQANEQRHQLTVFERNPEGATYGWGVVFSEGTLSELAELDYLTYLDLNKALVRWSAIDIRHRGQAIRSYGHGFSAISRRTLLGVLQQRALELGVEIRFQTEVAPAELLADSYDLVVAADGVNSAFRQHHAETFQPSAEIHPTRYIWLALPAAFDAFTFIFEETPHGLFQVHGYPYDASGSTFIVETTESTWRRSGLDQSGEAESVAFCEKVFADHLQGLPLLSNHSLWNTFKTLRNPSWHHLAGPGAPVVLIGDAAHTAHFSIGSGTKLAMEDAASLHQALSAHSHLPAALAAYEADRQPAVARFQEAARDSARYFEGVDQYLDLPMETFAFNLLTRSGRVTHLEMERRDPALTLSADRVIAGLERGLLVPRPSHTPISIGGVQVANRLVGALGETDGQGLLLTPTWSVSPEGRSHAMSPVIDQLSLGALRAQVDEIHRADAVAGVVIGHAGPRASSRPAENGLDRPLAVDGWDTWSCSAVAYTEAHSVPRSLDPDKMEEVLADFSKATELVADAGLDLLLLDAAHGHLLASFLSPLTNRRQDEFGGDLGARLRFPLRVVRSIRQAWKGALVVRFSATDWARSGTTVSDAITIAKAFSEAGADLLEVAAGGTTIKAEPLYRRNFLIGLASEIKHGAGVKVLIGGGIVSLDDADTAIAAARADLIRLDPYVFRKFPRNPRRV
jgi:anthraniloyl-CoA monooxygenase